MTGRLGPLEAAAVAAVDPAWIERELTALLAIPSVTGD